MSINNFNNICNFYNFKNDPRTFEYVLSILRKYPEDIELYNYILVWACKVGNTNVAKMLLEDKRIDPSWDDNFALKIALKHKHMKIVRLLLQDERTRLKLDDIGIMLYW